jgi:hypothetical protein
MSPEEQQLNPRHQPETVSTAIQQSFEDPEGGLPLDSPVVKAAGQQALVSRKRALMARQIAERTLIVLVNLACPGIRECSLLHHGQRQASSAARHSHPA